MLPSRAHVAGLCVLEEVIERRHIGDGQTFGAVQKAALYDVGSEEGPGGIERQFFPTDGSFLLHQLLGSERSVAVQGAQVFGKRAAGEMKNIRVEMSHA